MLRVQVQQCYVRSQTALSARRSVHCLFISSLCTALCSSQVRCNAWIYVRGSRGGGGERLGRRAVRLHGRLLCRRRCNAASETCRKKPSGESGPESTLCALWLVLLELYNWNTGHGSQAQCIALEALCDRLLL